MMFSKRDLLSIIVPLIIQSILSVTIGLVDSMMVSAAGESAMAGVSLVNSLDTLLVITFESLVTGGAVVVSQYIGKKDYALISESSKQLLYVSTFVAAIITVLSIVFRIPLLKLLFGKTESSVMENALGYFFFIALSFPFLAVFSTCSALFRSIGKTKVSMYVSLLMNLLNVAGNAIFIFVFHYAAVGAALATLISRVIGAILMLILLQSAVSSVRIPRLFHYKPDFPIIRSILGIGIPNGVENSMFQFGKLLTQSLISMLGTAAISANTVANTLATFQYMTGTAVSGTMVTVVGRCIGAREREQAVHYSRKLLFIGYCFLWIMILLTCLFAKPVIGLYNISSEAASVAQKLILYHAACAAVMWPISFMLPSAFRAASDVKFPLIVSSFCMWVFRVALGYVFALETVTVFGFSIPGLNMGVFGVWIAMTVDWVFRTILYAHRYFSGRWLIKYKFNSNYKR